MNTITKGKQRRIDHTYQTGNQVLIKQNQDRKFGKNPFKVSFTVVSTRDANVIVDENITTDMCSLKQIKPCRT